MSDDGVVQGITIHVYDDKIVFWNIGELIPPLDEDLLMREHPSIRRNELISDVFYRMGLIEAWGRGIKLIINESKKNNRLIPEINVHAGGIQVVLYKDGIKDGIKENYQLNPNQILIIGALRADAKITAKDLAEKIGITQRNVELNILKLKNQGLLERKGSRKYGYWEVR